LPAGPCRLDRQPEGLGMAGRFEYVVGAGRPSVKALICSTTSVFRPSMTCVAPNCRARSSFDGPVSTAMIWPAVDQPGALQYFNPTAPQPITTTVDPSGHPGFAYRRTHSVMTPQPMMQARSNGSSSGNP